MYIILKSELKFITKEMAKVLSIIIVGFILITAMILIKYKPLYQVTIAGEHVGYIKNKDELTNLIEKEIINQEGKNIDNVSLKNELTYGLKLVKRDNKENLNEIIQNVKDNNTTITYKYYIVALNNECEALVETFDEAEEVVNKIKSEYDGNSLELDLQILEEYKEDIQDISIDNIEIATTNVESKVDELIKEEEKENALAIVNGVNLGVLPVNGMITSRYGESSSRRRSTHTGLDIATKSGTAIKAAASGKVVYASTNGSYGKLVRIDHGNGVETWYGHCSSIKVKVGDEVKVADVISTVGSTGNSTGPHLHFEIRINNNTVNPQKYLY